MKDYSVLQLIEEFNSSIDSLIRKHTNLPNETKVTLGYDNAAITAQTQVLQERIDTLNKVLDHYFNIFSGLKKDKDTVGKLLDTLQSNLIESVIKSNYLDHIKYDYKGFGWKVDKVIALYDFPEHIEYGIKEIITLVQQSASVDTSFIQYFDLKKELFVLTEADAQQILDRNVVYAAPDTLTQIINTALFAKALEYEKKLNPDFYWSELPEIPWSLLQRLDFNRNNVYDDRIGVNLRHFLSRWISDSKQTFDVSVIGVDDRNCPLLKVNGQCYRVVHPNVIGVFSQNDQLDFRELSKLENREQLIKVAVLDISEGKGMLEVVESFS